MSLNITITPLAKTNQNEHHYSPAQMHTIPNQQFWRDRPSTETNMTQEYLFRSENNDQHICSNTALSFKEFMF